jgi:hypothetical protein
MVKQFREVSTTSPRVILRMITRPAKGARIATSERIVCSRSSRWSSWAGTPSSASRCEASRASALRGFHFRFPALQFGQADRTMLMEIFRPLKGQLRFMLPRRRLEVCAFGHAEIGTVEQRQPLPLLHILPHIDQHLDDPPSDQGS